MENIETKHEFTVLIRPDNIESLGCFIRRNPKYSEKSFSVFIEDILTRYVTELRIIE